MSPIAFAQNYEQSWVGSSEGSLVDINKLFDCRVLENAFVESKKVNDEYYLGVDVARSQSKNNNQSAIAVVRVLRNSDDKIVSLDVVNVITMPNALNFTAQACIIKKYKRAFKAKMVVVDGNGLGAGLVDELLKESYDPITGEYLGCFNTINTDNEPEVRDAEKCLFDMKAQKYQSKIVTDFIDAIDSGLLKLLVKKQESDFNAHDKKNADVRVVPFVQTDILVEEIANLKLKHMNNGGLSVEKVVNKVDKDRFSALSYVLFYILEESKNRKPKTNMKKLPKITSLARKPKIYDR